MAPHAELSLNAYWTVFSDSPLPFIYRSSAPLIWSHSDPGAQRMSDIKTPYKGQLAEDLLHTCRETFFHFLADI
jgi:hypothetical protein